MKISYPSLLNLYWFQYRLINCGTFTYNNKVKKELYSVYQKGRSFCTPKIDNETAEKISSIVGIQVGLSYVSWNKIETKENFLSCMNFKSLPEEIYKMELNQIYTIAHELITSIPKADCYVMESLPRIVAGGTGGKLQLMSQATRMQFISMIVAMLNLSRSEDDECLGVIFMKPLQAAKLFKLLVGSETTSSVEIVTKLLTNQCVEPFSLVKSSPEIISYYTQAERVHKEILGQPFLLTMSFIELVLKKNHDIMRHYLSIKRS